MKKIMIILVTIFSMNLVGSCSTDQDDEVITPEAAIFDLILDNNTGEEIEIFFKGSNPDNGFERLGSIGPDKRFVISDLIVHQTYVLRASFMGDSAEGYFYEQTINQTSPTDITLVINQ